MSMRVSSNLRQTNASLGWSLYPEAKQLSLSLSLSLFLSLSISLSLSLYQSIYQSINLSHAVHVSLSRSFSVLVGV